jgi:hypothetical protein
MTPEGLATRAEMVLDPRLVELWQLLWSGCAEDGLSEETLAGLLRLAYLQGFTDAKDEVVEGELYRELGLRAPASTTSWRRRGARSRSGSSGR